MSAVCQNASGAGVGTFNGTNAVTGLRGDDTSAITCTFTNSRRTGAIKIVSNTVGGNETFTFNPTGFNSGAAFDLTTVNFTAEQTFSNLSVGSSYSISEVAEPGWDAGTFSCDNGRRGRSRSRPARRPPAASPTPSRAPSRSSRTRLVGTRRSRSTRRALTAARTFDLTTVNFTAEQTFSNLSVWSSHSISEAAEPGWNAGTFSCDNGTAGAITVAAGATTTCSISNTMQGSIRIVKNTVGGDGTFGFTSNFGVSSIGTTAGTGSQTVNNLLPGSSYTISETDQVGWDEGTFPPLGSCTAVGITVTAGQMTTWSSATRCRGRSAIVKNTVGDGTFGFTSNFGASPIGTTAGTGSQTVNNLSPGSSYTISETVTRSSSTPAGRRHVPLPAVHRAAFYRAGAARSQHDRATP